MELLFISEWIHWLKDLINPEILAKAGFFTLFLIIFAETGLLIGFFLPGDSLLVITGSFCNSGEIDVNFPLLMVSLMVAAILGDQTGYLIGRTMGEKLFQREESWFFKPKHITKTRAFYDKHGGKTIILGRFVPIVRTFAPMIAGVVKLEYKTFVMYNVVGGIVWIGSMLSVGYFLVEFFPGLKKHIHYVALVVIFLSIIPIITTYIQEKREAQNEKK